MGAIDQLGHRNALNSSDTLAMAILASQEKRRRGRDLRWTERRQEEPQTPLDRAGLHIEVGTS